MRIRKLICIGMAAVMLFLATACAGSATGGAEDVGTKQAVEGDAAVNETTAKEAEGAGTAAKDDKTEGASGEEAKAAEAGAAAAAGQEEASDAGEEAAAASTAAATAAMAASDTASAADAVVSAAAAGATASLSAADTPAAAAEEEIPAEDISVLWEDSRFYYGTSLGQYQTIKTYAVKGFEDVPFIRASDYLDFLYEGSQRVEVEDGVMKITVNGAQVIIDSKADTLSIDNTGRLLFDGAPYSTVDGAVIGKNEYNVITVSEKNKSFQTEVKPLYVSLKEYGLPAVAYEGDILMPFLALQNTIGAVTFGSCMVYNGKDYYNAFAAYSNAPEKDAGYQLDDMPYMKAYYSGPFSEKTNTTQAYADYAYHTICLLLDLTFGHKEEKNITTFDEYFTRIDAKKSLTSTNPNLAMTAEMMLFMYLFDSGHDALIGMETIFGKVGSIDKSEAQKLVDDIKNSEAGGEYFDEKDKVSEEETQMTTDTILGALLEKGLKIPEIAPLTAWTMYFEKTKPEDYGQQRLDYVGDTAVIYFSAFKDDYKRDPSYYLKPVSKEDEEDSNFAFFYNCFEDIRQHSEVKNVVLNISDNGGGQVTGLVTILGFLSEDGEVRITLKDLTSDSYKEECYHVDTNLDGIADAEDGYGGQYDFYIMTSGSSYSCGNALPYFAQKEGLAKIIGTQPGGGDCVVGTFVDAYGYCAVYSSWLKLGTEETDSFVSDEKATKVDLNMMPSILDINLVPWYDPEGITDAVHRYKSGETEIVYSEDQEAENLSRLLELILNMFAQQQ